MKSVDRLREKIRKDVNNPWSDLKGDLLSLVDKIEAEIEERYIELPVDADGEPIHVGDKLECNANGYEGTFTVFAVGNGVAVGDHDTKWIMDNPAKWFHVASACHHVKPRTLEDIIGEFGYLVAESASYPMLDDVRKYAAEIRELLGGDAE